MTQEIEEKSKPMSLAYAVVLATIIACLTYGCTTDLNREQEFQIFCIQRTTLTISCGDRP